MNNVTISEPGSHDSIEEADDDECDGWGPIRARRPSVPSAPLRADAEHGHEHERDKSAQRDKPLKA
jgi:hypothetical protein